MGFAEAVLGFSLSALLAAKLEEGRFVGAYGYPGIGAADERAAIIMRFCPQL